jgi:hypothetical protein
MKLCGVLTDALELCLLLAEKEPARYERAALRWHARYCAETRGVGVGDAQVVLGLLALLPGERGFAAAEARGVSWHSKQRHGAQAPVPLVRQTSLGVGGVD